MGKVETFFWGTAMFCLVFLLDMVLPLFPKGSLVQNIIGDWIFKIAIFIMACLTVSLAKTIFAKKRFERGDSLLIAGIPAIILFLLTLGMTDWTSGYSVLILFGILLVFYFSTAFFICLPFLNIFQRVFLKQRAKMEIPLSRNLKAGASLIIALFLICAFYFILEMFGTWLFLILGIFPLVLALFFLGKPIGEKINLEDHPRLNVLLKHLSSELGIELPKTIILVPGTEIAVMGVFHKKLIIGVASLRHLSTDELYAIFSHEFGHFYGLDTVIGYFLGHIERSLVTSIQVLSRVRMFYTLIALLFIWIYLWIYRLATLSLSRQKEYIADIIAANISGSNTFENALVKYAGFSLFFEKTAPSVIITLGMQKKLLKNVYKYYHEAIEISAEIKKSTKQVLEQEDNIFHSHPSVKSRIENISGIPKLRPKNIQSSIKLLNGYEGLEEKESGLLSLGWLGKTGIVFLDKDKKLKFRNV